MYVEIKRRKKRLKQENVKEKRNRPVEGLCKESANKQGKRGMVNEMNLVDGP